LKELSHARRVDATTSLRGQVYHHPKSDKALDYKVPRQASVESRKRGALMGNWPFKGAASLMRVNTGFEVGIGK
jgi:hypothetical protein